MGTYYMPIVFTIEADSIEEAQNALSEWSDSIDMNTDVPNGTDDVDISPTCEYNDEGQRVLYLPVIENDLDTDSDVDDMDDGDDFNDSEEDP